MAAGASTRMGRPKQLLKWKEATLLQHVISICEKTLAKKVFVVLGANYELIYPKISKDSVNVIHNTSWHLGLGKSIACATKQIINSIEAYDGLLVVLGDQPFLTTSFLDKLISDFDVNSKSILATGYGGNSGVPVLFHKYYFRDLSELSGDNGAKLLLKKNEKRVECYRPDFDNMDIDTEVDYLKIVSSSKQ